MVLRFKDSSGKSIDFEVGSDVPAMQWQEGKLTSYTDFDNNILYEYSTFTPLVTLRVSLNRLSGINLADLKEVEFLFKDTESGSIMLRSISQV